MKKVYVIIMLLLASGILYAQEEPAELKKDKPAAEPSEE